MPVIINGTTGISGVDGSAGTPAFQGSDANTGIRFGTDIVSLVTGGSDRLYVDSSGRLGVGTSSPGSALDVLGAISLGAVALPSAGTARLFSRNTDSNLYIQAGSGNTIYLLDGSQNTMAGFGPSSVFLSTGNTARLTIDSSGRVGIGTTSITNSVNVDIVSVIPPATDTYSKLQLRAGNYGYFLEGGLKQGIGSQLRFNITDDASTKMMLDAGGRLLVGTTTHSGNERFIVNNAISGGSAIAQFKNEINPNYGGLLISGGITDRECRLQSTYGNSFLTFYTEPSVGSAAERMRITSNGNVFINSSSNPAVGTEMFGVAAQSSGQTIAAGFANTVNTAPTVFISNGSNTTNTFLMRFASGSGGNTRGEIYYNGSQLVYATSSDYRLKENIQPFSGGIEIVKQLRPVKYNWIENSNEDIGFIAHEVQEVFPNAVGGEKDAVDENGKILPQTYDPSKLVPLLTAALQEAISEIESLKARLTAAGI